MVVVEKVTRGHFKSSSKVISKYKGDLTKTLTNFVSGIIGKVIYLARGSLTMNIEMLALARGIGHQRLLKVTNQGLWSVIRSVIRSIFSGANSTKGFTSPVRNPTSPYHLLLCICKENPHYPKKFEVISDKFKWKIWPGLCLVSSLNQTQNWTVHLLL